MDAFLRTSVPVPETVTYGMPPAPPLAVYVYEVPAPVKLVPLPLWSAQAVTLLPESVIPTSGFSHTARFEIVSGAEARENGRTRPPGRADTSWPTRSATV